MQYADALPALIRDNIGDAPLTVMFLLVLSTLGLLNFKLGLDFYIAKNNPDRRTIAVSQVDLEVVG